MSLANSPTLHLSDYLNAIKTVMDNVFDHDVWVICEVRAMSQKSGHYYFELASKNNLGQINASCRATLWRYHAERLLSKFKRSTGRQLEAGMQVLLRGRASLHPQYGFAFNITDIDPNYTLGEMAQAYQAMQDKLIANGLMDLNKHLAPPFDIQKVAVIAPQNAAGLGDFRAEADRLENANACQFDYHHATFQGNHAPQEIRQAIAAAIHNNPDILVIIRGGGAVGDLAYLNDYELAAMVAECPMPVWVGIGHERDTVILDEVAHSSFDTPSKVIAGIERYLVNRWQAAKAYFTSINHQTRLHSKQHSTNTNALLSTIHHATQLSLSAHKYQTHSLYQNINKNSQFALKNARNHNQNLINDHKIVFKKMNIVRSQIGHWQALILTHHPKTTLNKGYALIQKSTPSSQQDPKPIFIKSITDLKTNDKIEIILADGKRSAIVVA